MDSIYCYDSEDTVEVYSVCECDYSDSEDTVKVFSDTESLSKAKKATKKFFRSPDGLYHCPHKGCSFSTPYRGMARHYNSIHKQGGTPLANKRFFRSPDGLYYCPYPQCNYSCKDPNITKHYKKHENNEQKKRFFKYARELD